MAASQDLLGRLQAHLGQLEEDPINTEIDERLFESCSLALAPGISKKESITLISQLSRILPVLQKDPTHPIQFLVLLLEPLSYADVLGLNSAVDFVGGLHIAAVPYNRLMLALLIKAAGNATDAATIAAQPEVVTALVNLWLCSSDAGIGKQAGDVLLALLKVDHAVPPGAGAEESLPGHSQGLMWKRVFGDQDIYTLIFSVCSLKHTEGVELSGSQRTLAQARLLEWLPEVGAVNWNAITHAHHREVEKRYTDGKGEGMLYFAAACMVDTADDVLMHRCLVEFYAILLQTINPTETAGSPHSSAALDFLVEHKLHDEAMKFYLDPKNPRHDPLDVQFLYAPSANYIAAYVSSYPSHFMASPLKPTLNKRLQSSLDLSRSQWAHGESPKHDLHILSSMPRTSLLPRNKYWASSPLSLLPSKHTNADVLATLATIFHGPSKQEIINYPPSSPLMNTTHDATWKSEAQAAYALYYLYLNHNPTLFADLVQHANIVVLREVALASISLIRSIATANWLPLTETSTPTSADFKAVLHSTALAEQSKGFLALLSPPSLEYTLPYLLSATQTFSNLVGGVGDTENSAYRVAMSKFECLKEVYNRLSVHCEEGGEEGKEWGDVVKTLRKKVDEGPFGSRSAEVGGRIATMEM
jgi:hypothetical protein